MVLNFRKLEDSEETLLSHGEGSSDCTASPWCSETPTLRATRPTSLLLLFYFEVSA